MNYFLLKARSDWIRRVLVCTILLLTFTLSFQNCSRFESSKNGVVLGFDPKVFSGIDGSFELDWKVFREQTQAAMQPYQSDLSVFPFTDSSALVRNGQSLYIFETSNNSIRKLYSDQIYLLGSGLHYPYLFPSLKRVALITSKPERTRHLTVIDVTNGRILYQSEALFNHQTPCVYNTQDEEKGRILCQFHKPTSSKPNEVQLGYFDVNTLTMSKLAPVPDDYNLVSEMSNSRHDLFSHQRIYQIPHTKLAVVQVRNSSQQTVDFLFSPTEARLFPSTETLDFDGSGTLRTFGQFLALNKIGRTGLAETCSATLAQDAPTSFYSFSTTPSRSGNRLCLTGQNWVMPSTGELFKCGPNGNNCAKIDLEINGNNMITSSRSNNSIYLASDQSILLISALGSQGGLILQKINTQTGARIILLPGQDFISESIRDVEGATIISSSEIRILNGTAVSPYKLYTTEKNQITDLPILPGTASRSVYWYQRRLVNSVNYIIGIAQNPDSNETTAIVSDSGEASWFSEKLIFERGNGTYSLSSPYLYLADKNNVIAYHLETKIRQNVAQVPFNFQAISIVRTGNLVTVSAFNSLDRSRKFLIFKEGKIIFQQDISSNSGEMLPSRDGQNIIFQYNDSNGYFISRFNVASEQISEPFQCSKSTSGCTINVLQTPRGEIYTTNFGAVLDANLKVLATLPGGILRTMIVVPDVLVSGIYYQTVTVDPQIPGERLTTYYRFDISTLQSSLILAESKGSAQPFYDNLFIYQLAGSEYIGDASLWNATGKIRDIQGIAGISLTARTASITTKNGTNRRLQVFSYLDPTKATATFDLDALVDLTPTQLFGNYTTWRQNKKTDAFKILFAPLL